MANSGRESQSPNSDTNANADASANVDAAPLPSTGAVPVPARALQIGEGSSAVPVVQETVEALSSSSSSSPSPTPPRRVLEISLGGMKNVAGAGAAKQKRALPASGKKGGDDKTQAAEKKPRKKAEMDAPTSEPMCSLCGKKFGSWKAVFGHLRSHPERDWRGAFPPSKPVAGTWSPIKMSGPQDFAALQVQLLAPTLLDMARETLSKMRQESVNAASSSAAPAPAVAGSSRIGDIDLNREPASSSPPPPPQAGGNSGSGGLDLNKPPPPESDDENVGSE